VHPDNVLACTEAGMDGFLTKPVSVTALRDALNRGRPGTDAAMPASALETARSH
jgi:CheY-like chemotaxis protein